MMFAYTHREPYGVVVRVLHARLSVRCDVRMSLQGQIIPWNAPLVLISLHPLCPTPSVSDDSR